LRQRLPPDVTMQQNRVIKCDASFEAEVDSRVAMACSTSARIFVWDRFTAC
jgi:hypothetical protein